MSESAVLQRCDDHRRPGLSVLTIVLACAVFPLILVGAGVTSKGAGMAFPDGFTANGHFWTNPPGWWDADDTRWEHGHRLLGRAVGILAIVAAIWSWRYGGLVRRLGLVTLGAIVVQGVLGALRVDDVSTTLAMIHGIFGQLCFGLACVLALVTSRTWQARPLVRVRAATFLQRLCVVGAVGVFIQLVLGAGYRHFGGGTVLVGHVFWAVVVIFIVGWLAMWVMGLQRGGLLVRIGQVVAGLMAVQLILGGAAYLVTMMPAGETVWHWLVPTLHTAVGALLLSGTILLAMLSYRLLRPAAVAHSAYAPGGLASA